MTHGMQRNSHTHTLKHTRTRTYTTPKTRMGAKAGGPPFPLWYTEKTHALLRHTLTEYLVCNRIRRNLKAQKHVHGAYRRRHGNKERESTRERHTHTISHPTVAPLPWRCHSGCAGRVEVGTYVGTGTPSWCGCALVNPPGWTRWWVWTRAAWCERGLGSTESGEFKYRKTANAHQVPG